MRITHLPVAALICSISLGCTSETQRAQTTAQAFLSAFQNGDSTRLQATLTPLARSASRDLLRDIKPQDGGFMLSAAQVQETTARVPAVLRSKTNDETKATVLLRRAENVWQVYALEIELTPGKALTMDFEHPEASVGEALGLVFRELGEGLGKLLGGFMRGIANGIQSEPPPTLRRD